MLQEREFISLLRAVRHAASSFLTTLLSPRLKKLGGPDRRVDGLFSPIDEPNPTNPWTNCYFTRLISGKSRISKFLAKGITFTRRTFPDARRFRGAHGTIVLSPLSRTPRISSIGGTALVAPRNSNLSVTSPPFVIEKRISQFVETKREVAW